MFTAKGDPNMNQSLEILITKVELSDDREHLYLHTRNYEDCNRLWSQLAGQALDRTEGRRPIPYNIPEDPPESLVLDVESDTDKLVLVLQYLEIELKGRSFLSAGTTERIRKQITITEKSNIETAFFDTSTKATSQEVADPLSEIDAGVEKKSTFK